MSQLQSTKFIWAIENFSSLNDKEYHWSDDFVVGGFTWYIKIYPKELDGYFGMYLMPNGVADKSPYVEYTLTVFNQKNHKKIVTKDGKQIFGTTGWGFSMMPLSDLHDSGKGFIIDDTYIVQVEISVGWVNDSNTKVVKSETEVYPDAGKPLEIDQGVVFHDENHEIVGGFTVLRRQASLYKRIWLKYGHIASTKVLTATSYNSLVTIVTDIMNTVIDMYRCRYIDVSAELIGTWECKIRLAEKLEFSVSWLRDRFDDVNKDFNSGRIEKLQKEEEEKEGPTPLVQVKNEPVDDIQESLPGFLFEGML
ncbi:hypothetical protein MKX03_004102 [Papaver bracteatum]|nr:hypothetical protein MKX03_004102 [Papaver bracteatum]